MAPEIALKQCGDLPVGSVVLDPMCGSGTTLRTATELGFSGIGIDSDPLAVLMSRVYTTPIHGDQLPAAAERIVSHAQALQENVVLPWIDEDPETGAFIDFWFADKQKTTLRKLSYVLSTEHGPTANALRIAMSRIIITKEMSASLARDTSHSRPHRVATENAYDVYEGFLKSAKQISKKLPTHELTGTVDVSRGDARDLYHQANASVDAIVTSPPYLNQIDYMRGHKLSLVWLGYKLSDLRTVRGTNIGAEKKAISIIDEGKVHDMMDRMPFIGELDTRTKNMFERYLADLVVLMSELARVLKDSGKIVMVVGNSCIKGVFVENTMAVQLAGEAAGLTFKGGIERDLPPNRRYLPPPTSMKNSIIEGRMRTESVMSFSKA